MPLPHKKKKKKNNPHPKITTALARAAKAGVRRAVAPTKSEQAEDARKRALERIKREGAGQKPHIGRRGRTKPKPEKPKKESLQERATRGIGLGPLLDINKPKNRKKR